MSYLSSGFNKLLYKIDNSVRNTQEMSEDVASQTITLLSGSNITGGSTVSKDGKMEIDWDSGRIVISDGANPRIVIGQVD